MKQHITPEQLNELSEKGKKELREWAWPHKSENSETSFTSRYDLDEFVMYDGEPHRNILLSIGQMIEFLDEHLVTEYGGTDLNLEIYQPQIFGDNDWFVRTKTMVDRKTGQNNEYEKEYIESELCDALWEATKSILSKE